MDVRLALLALAACSSNKARTAEDATRIAPRADAAIARDGGAVVPAGEAQIRVEWPDVPVAMRASPGRTSCNTPRTPLVSPTTTWGVPDAIVIADGKATGAVRVVAGDCTLTPRALVGATLAIASAVDHPIKLVLTRRGEVAHLDKLDGTDARTILLPITGHEVTVALDDGAVYELATDGADPETTWIVAARGLVADATGQVHFHDAALGSFAVTAWLPPRASFPAHLARGKVEVAAGALAEVTVGLSP